MLKIIRESSIWARVWLFFGAFAVLIFVAANLVYRVRFCVPAEDYRVYDAAIEYLCQFEWDSWPGDDEDYSDPRQYFLTKGKDKTIVVSNRTIDKMQSAKVEDSLTEFRYPETLVPAEVLKDYVEKNAELKTVVRNSFKHRWRTLLNSSDNSSGFFNSIPGNYVRSILEKIGLLKPKLQFFDFWNDFYDKYPNAQGIMYISRVGYSPDGRKALVSISNHSYMRASADVAVYLELKDGTWKIVDVSWFGVS